VVETSSPAAPLTLTTQAAAGVPPKPTLILNQLPPVVGVSTQMVVFNKDNQGKDQVQGAPGVRWKSLADIPADLKTVGFPKVIFERSMLTFFTVADASLQIKWGSAEIKQVCFPKSEHYGQNTCLR
jgi:hypothetical protein